MEKKILNKLEKHNIINLIPFDISKLKISEWVKLKCKFGCDSYNTNHACSPATFSVSEFREMVKDYKKAVLAVGKGEGIERQNRFIEGMTLLEREYFLLGYYKAFALTNGPCQRCEKCTYPDNCRFPKLVRPAAESVGIDMFATIRALNQDIKVLKEDDEFKCYGLILLE